jgi:hypothetical protein
MGLFNDLTVAACVAEIQGGMRQQRKIRLLITINSAEVMIESGVDSQKAAYDMLVSTIKAITDDMRRVSKDPDTLLRSQIEDWSDAQQRDLDYFSDLLLGKESV